MAELVYILCAVASAVCAGLLLRGFLRSRTRLLFWSSLCFAALALHNLLLVVDLIVLPQVDLFYLRTGTALIAMLILVFGLIWESGE
jgi:hypothetical protein